MRTCLLVVSVLAFSAARSLGQPPTKPRLIEIPDAFQTLVNPSCSHCRDEAKRRAGDLKDNDRVLCWIRGYSEGGAIPIRFFLAPYRVISDSYGVFVYDPDAGYARGFAPSYEFRFHGWRNGVMVMKHADGTLYSCLTGLAFDGPRKGTRLKPIPTLVSDWGFCLKHYPNAVAYHMFDKYQPIDLPTKVDSNELKSRGTADPRLPAEAEVLGVWTGKAARAYPVKLLEKSGFLNDEIDGEPVVVVWEPRTRSAAAYRLKATQPRKFKAPAPDAKGISPPDDGTPIAPETSVVPERTLSFDALKSPAGSGRMQDKETQSTWDVAGRCVDGKLKGWTLECPDGVQVKWFAWAAEYPETTIYAGAKVSQNISPPSAAAANKAVKEIAGTAEFLRLLPKPFATLKAVDPIAGTATLLLDGESAPKTWPVEPDAEVKVGGWWGRLSQFKPEDRVWAWLKLDRKKKPVSIVMLADEVSEFDLHTSLAKKKKDPPRFSSEEIEGKRVEQKAWLGKKWLEEGLPGTLTFHHVFSGELEITLDHEAVRWGRSLNAGEVVHITTDPPIKGVVKIVTPWRDRTVVRLVVGELESSELKIGQRVGLKMAAPKEMDAASPYPLDIGRTRSKPERIEWFLASIYCDCGVDKDTCTGHFYTLASCNPNGCGMPNHMRAEIKKLIEKGFTDQQVFDELVKSHSPYLLKPHLAP